MMMHTEVQNDDVDCHLSYSCCSKYSFESSDDTVVVAVVVVDVDVADRHDATRLHFR